MNRMRVLVEEVIQMFPHVVRRLFVEFFAFRRGDLHELVVRGNVVPRVPIERAVTCVEINQ